MRKIFASLFVSLDGGVESPEKWATPLKQQPGKNIVILGSPTLVRSLLRDGLLDELGLSRPPRSRTAGDGSW